MKGFVFWSKFHWSLFLKVKLTISQPNRRQAIIWTNAGPIHWRIYAALGENELIYPYLIIDSLLYFKDLICIFAVHLYRSLCLTISSLTCSALGCLMNMLTFRPPARWAQGILWWSRTAVDNVVFCLVKSLSLFLYCLSEIKFTTTNQTDVEIWHGRVITSSIKL